MLNVNIWILVLCELFFGEVIFLFSIFFNEISFFLNVDEVFMYLRKLRYWNFVENKDYKFLIIFFIINMENCICLFSLLYVYFFNDDI